MGSTADTMSIWSLVSNAALLVQIVMALLLLASMMSWGMIAVRYRVLTRARRAGMGFEDRFWSADDLSTLYHKANQAPDPDSGQESIFRAGFKEFVRLRKGGAADPDAVMEGAQRAMRVALSREQARLSQSLPFLATVGSTSPYVGLFGTVWGIMNAFRALANVSQATLSVVAPGIAEALVATAMGLFAAIPAVIAYNRYAAMVDELMAASELFAEEFSSILHRQAHGRRSPA